eukprot:CAMPEP_0119266998 /NCGR_PEP_ID=MMETSP1329-20130426/5298_1 /TAXON_ID=114041 /ORGANISM="Genus nov. species nov., Strain RCC1024" /LENGTH=421 /DNA_ID=CAMNT_0007266903 /DNA_START=118 /DNA_END=1380 /DNA_ORIENTATION=-
MSDDGLYVPTAAPVPHTSLGGDHDEHGCYLDGGYSYCAALDACVRSWETPCPNATHAPTYAPSALPSSVPSSVPTPRPRHSSSSSSGEDTLGRYDQALLIAGLCTIVSVLLSLHLIQAHLKHYVKPQRQRYVVRILWMVPIYAIDSYLSLVFIQWAILFEVPRDAYEAYILYNFFALMVDYMGGEAEAKAFFAGQPPQKHWWPFGWLGEHDMSVFLETSRLCVLQYSIVRPVTAICTLFLWLSRDYDDADWKYDSSYLWLMLINNSSVTLALYYLMYFYHASLPCKPLQKAHPLAKFLAVKAVVFFCFWQYCLISLLASMNLITRQLAHRSKDATTTGLNDFVVCVEMAAFAIIHLGVFGWREHQEASAAQTGAAFNPLSNGRPGGSDGWDPNQRQEVGMDYDAAYRDMFFVGDVTADLGR